MAFSHGHTHVCVCICVFVCVRARERESFIRNCFITGGLGPLPRKGSASPYSVLHINLYGEDYPRTLIRGASDGTVEPVRYRQETLGLAA
jgi:hypothetical protein